jgi:peptide/nickel transport system substrate-binding protein
LLRYGEDGKVYGVMVDGIESSDPSTWVMRMRDYVKFTDGTPIDANSVKTNWMWHADQANSSQAYDLASQIASLEVVDPKTLKITLKAPNDKFALDVTNSQLNTMASPKSMGMKDVFAKRPFAAGPFMVSEWIPNDHLTLVRNPYYYLKDHPYVRELKFLLQADVQQKITALKSGVPVMVQVTSADEAAKYTEQGLAVSGPSGGTQWVANELVKGLKVWGQGYYNPEEIWLVQSK